MIFWRRKRKKQDSFGRLKQGLSKTRGKFAQGLKAFLSLGRRLDEGSLDELTEVLLSADVGPRAAERVVADLRRAWEEKAFEKPAELREHLRRELKSVLSQWDTSVRLADEGPTVFLVVGVNGSGKTTSISKLAHLYKEEGKRVLMAACDTYRAAAVEQLSIWAERVGVGIVKTQMGADPAAVAFDAVDAALARKADILIIDTAGRLQTKDNLMRELSKIARVVSRKIPGAPHEVFLVMDATTGQNGLSQARLFSEAVKVTGIILAKLDGTARGGVVLGMRDEISIPVKFVGLGEKQTDLQPFDPEAFVDALLEA